MALEDFDEACDELELGLERLDLTASGGLDPDDLLDEGIFDSGPGVPPELVSRVADPFFTTRAEGTGLGLALVHTVARRHGGSLRVSSTPGPLGGAYIQLLLPLEAHAALPASPAYPCDAR